MPEGDQMAWCFAHDSSVLDNEDTGEWFEFCDRQMFMMLHDEMFVDPCRIQMIDKPVERVEAE